MKYVIVLLFFILVGCSKSSTPVATQVVVTETKVLALTGKVVTGTASELGVEIESDIIQDELGQMVKDGKKFIGSVVSNDFVISTDGTVYSNDIDVYSENGKIKIFAKSVTNKTGLYKLKIQSPDSPTAFSFFYLNLLSGQPSMALSVQGSVYEDKSPYNGMKDENENWTLISDGLTSGYISVGEIKDAYGNIIDNAKVRLTTVAGTILSENPTLSFQGMAYFNIEPDETAREVDLTFDILDNDNNIIFTKMGKIEFVRQNIVLSGDSIDFGQVFVNQDIKRNIIVTNQGNTSARNVTYNVQSPFNIINEESSCYGKTLLRPSESCNLSISFSGGVRDLFEGNFSIISSPSSVSTSKINEKIIAYTVAPPKLVPEQPIYDLDMKKCGTTYDVSTYFINEGDIQANNIEALSFKNTISNVINSDFSIVLPPKEDNPSANINDIIDCGTVAPPGRKCRMVIRYTPSILSSIDNYQAEVSIDNQSNNMSFLISAGVRTGDPTSPLSIKLTNPDSINPNQEITEINSSYSVRTKATVGPLKDSCGNDVQDGVIVAALADKGTITNPSEHSNNGIVEFEWRGSNDPNDIGLANLIVSAVDATGTKTLQYNGIKLSITGDNDLGQILTKKAKTFLYTITNSGTISANNLYVELGYGTSLDSNNDGSPDRTPWGGLDINYDGGCKDGILLAGESCTIQLNINTNSFGIGNFAGTILISSSELGLNSASINIGGRSELPPILITDMVTYNMGTIMANPVYSTQVVRVTNQGPATAFNFLPKVAQPFRIQSSDCGPELLGTAGSNFCDVIIELPVNTIGVYTGLINMESEYSSTTANITGRIIPGIANGNIDVSFDKLSVPSDRNSSINITIGPIKDAFGNTVPQNVPLTILYDAGSLSVDADGDGSVVATTDSNGMVIASIRSKALDEVKPFTITVKALDGTDIIASGSKTGNFTGAIANFTATNVNFGNTTIGVVQVQTIVFQNQGSEDLSNLNFTLSNSYYTIMDYGTCNTTPKKILAGQSCTITVSFFPPQAGNTSAILTVIGTGNGVLTDSVVLNGNAVLPAKLQISIGVIEGILPPAQTLTKTYTIINEGSEPVSNISVLSDKDNSFFTHNTSSCSNIPALGSCNISFVFNPTNLNNGNFIANLRVSGDSPSRVVFVDQPIIIKPAKFIFDTVNPSAYSGECSNINLKLIDSNLNYIAPSSSMLVWFSSNLGGSFYDGANCTGSAVLNAFFTSGSTSKSMSFKPSATGNYSLTAINPVIISGAFLLNVSKLKLAVESETNSNLISNINDCVKIEMTLKDDIGNNYLAKSNINFSVTTSASGTYYLDNTCSTSLMGSTTSISSNNSSRIFYYKPANVGNHSIIISNANIDILTTLVFNVLNLLSLETLNNNYYQCKQGQIISACTSNALYNAISNLGTVVNNFEKTVSTNIVSGTTSLTVNSTSGLSTGQLVLIKTQPTSETDTSRMFKQEFGYITGILNSTTVLIKGYSTSSLSIAQNGLTNNVRLILVPEVNTLYLKSGSKIIANPINFSTGSGGTIAVSVKNKIIGEKSSPLNSINLKTGYIYGDGITIYVDENNKVEIIGGN